MSCLYSISPRGFGYLASDDSAVDSAINRNGASLMMEAVWAKYDNRTYSSIPVAQVLTLAKVMKSHIGDLREWCIWQIENNHKLSYRGIEFIVDCINYANGELRVYQPIAWDALLNGDTLIADTATRRKAFDHVTIPSTEDFIANWLQQPDGVVDMFASAKVLFGSL